jgi:oligoendopeptidase F
MAGKDIRWSLDDIAKGEEGFDSLINGIREDVKKIQGFRKALSSGMPIETFREILLLRESLNEKAARASSFAGLMSSEDIKSQKAMTYCSILDTLGIEVADSTRFLSHWIKGKDVEGLQRLDDANAKWLFAAIPELEYGLDYARLAAKHTLSENEESIIHKKEVNGIDVVAELYDQIANDFAFAMSIRGRKKKIANVEALLKLTTNADRDVRKAAYDALLETYRNNREKIFTIYAAIAKDWRIDNNMRKFETPIAARNFSNRVPDGAVDALLASCEANAPLFHRYFRKKAHLLGLERLERHDVYAPVKNAKEKKYSYSKASRAVLLAMGDFSPSFRKKAESVIKAGHVDVYPRKDKRHGAFCAAIAPGVLPYVMLNHNGRQRDVSTLAHELGHAVHDIYSSRLPISAMQATLPLAETASTLNELILFDSMLASAEGDGKLAMVCEKIGESWATIVRQAFFVKFEKAAHGKIYDDNINEEELSSLYYGITKQQFGDSVGFDDSFRHEWCHIPHIFHSPFYCYAYSFGELLTFALYSRYKKEGSPFVPEIEKMLSSGSSRAPEAILKDIGFDMMDRKFWDSGFSVIETWIADMEKA